MTRDIEQLALKLKGKEHTVCRLKRSIYDLKQLHKQ